MSVYIIMGHHLCVSIHTHTLHLNIIRSEAFTCSLYMSTPDISRPCHLQPISKTMIDSNSSCRMLAAFWYCSDKSNPIGHSTIRVCWWDLRLWHLIQFDGTLYLLDSNLLAWSFGYANQGTFTATDLEIHLQFPWCVLSCPSLVTCTLFGCCFGFLLQRFGWAGHS